MSQTPNSWYAVNAKAGDAEAEVMIYDAIGAWGITADKLVRDIKAIDASRINVRLNTPGGEVFDGTAIHNALKSHPARVIVHIDGLAASAGSFIALAGDEIRMASNAYVMVHEAAGGVFGRSSEMRTYAEMLDKINGNLARMYADRSGKPDADWRDMMAAETWFTADEAKEAGLVDTVTDGDKPSSAAAATTKAVAYVRDFDRVPEALRARLDLKPMSALTQGQTLPARVGGAEAAPPETPMNAETFSKYAAENPDAAEVKSIFAKGHKSGSPTPAPMRRSA
jgi:ATP-dependent Clp endopeptidase proteolytic subunit ClpP